MADPVALYDVDDQVGIITLNRPDKLNAISPDLQHQLLDAFTRADADPATSVVLLRAPDTTSGRKLRERMTGAATRPRRTPI